jgi:hypothetical protein
MIFKWGSYSHEQAENAVKTEHHAVLDNFGRRIGEKIRYTVLGVKRAATQAGLTTALNTLISEYQNDYRDFGLYLDDGTTPTSMVVSNAATFGGTRVVVPPSMINGPWSGRPEYAQQKTYFLSLNVSCGLPRMGTMHGGRDSLSRGRVRQSGSTLPRSSVARNTSNCSRQPRTGTFSRACRSATQTTQPRRLRFTPQSNTGICGR